MKAKRLPKAILIHTLKALLEQKLTAPKLLINGIPNLLNQIKSITTVPGTAHKAS